MSGRKRTSTASPPLKATRRVHSAARAHKTPRPPLGVSCVPGHLRRSLARARPGGEEGIRQCSGQICGAVEALHLQEFKAKRYARRIQVARGGVWCCLCVSTSCVICDTLSVKPHPSHTAHTAHTLQEGLVFASTCKSREMEVSVRHTETGDSCVVGVPEGGTVVGLKADALEEMFPGSINNASREAACVAAHIEGCEEELDDEERVADTGLEDGGAVKLVPRWPNVKAPAVYNSAHGEMIYYITLSKCGTLCAVGYDKGFITVFDTTNAAVVADFTYGNRSISCTAFSVCGTWLATSSRDGTTCVWLTATWEEVCVLDHNAVHSATWTQCGRLVSGDFRNKLRVWDLKGTPSATLLEGHSKAVFSIAVSDTKIFSGSDDKTIRVWDINTSHTHTHPGGAQ